MQTIIIPFNGNEVTEIVKLDAVQISVSWDSLLNVISESVKLRPDEIIDGLIVNETDIRVKISRRRGRKIKS